MLWHVDQGRSADSGYSSQWVANRQSGRLYGHNRYLGEMVMLETIAIILIILWLLGLVSSYTIGGMIHVLLVIAIVVILLRVIQGRRI